MKRNNTSSNIEETNFIIWKKRKQNVTFNNELLLDEKVDGVEEKLGVYADSSLTWQDHIQYIKGKIARALGGIWKASISSMQPSLKYYTTPMFIHIWTIVSMYEETNSLFISYHWTDYKKSNQDRSGVQHNNALTTLIWKFKMLNI